VKQLLAISIVLLAFASCNKNKTKKDPLEGNVAFLEGCWEWKYTRHKHDFCAPGTIEVDTIFSNEISDSYSINFIQDGFIEYYKNDLLLEEKHISFGDIIEVENTIYFDIFPNEDLDFLHGCTWRNDSLYFGGFPYRLDENGCNFYVNYFEKE
jgi:hypothetical protein